LVVDDPTGDHGHGGVMGAAGGGGAALAGDFPGAAHDLRFVEDV
jgi:hypothetical protein